MAPPGTHTLQEAESPELRAYEVWALRGSLVGYPEDGFDFGDASKYGGRTCSQI